MYSNMALMVRIPASEEFSREEMASKQEQLKMLTRFVEMLTPEGAKPNEASAAEKQKEASSQKQNLISKETNFAMLLRHFVEKLIQRPSETLEAAKKAKTNEASEPEKPKEASSQKQNLISSETDVQYKRH